MTEHRAPAEAADVSIEIRGEKMSLLAERAAYWHREQTLLIADPHWGKAATFRASGIPVPSGTTEETLARLRSAAQRTAARKVVFLGDLLHARDGRSAEMFAALARWRYESLDVEVILVRGNHDRRAGDPPAGLAIECVDAPYVVSPFVLAHHPVTSDTGYVIAGHVHPAIRIYGSARESLRLPCFVIGDRRAILPAFGDFTGAADIVPLDADRIYAVAEGEVISV